ncbi:Protein of unknown function [Bradyrhizobium erythrophlei]|nr:Protein of unknown function [Bradyrhizobium erythrophlei]
MRNGDWPAPPASRSRMAAPRQFGTSSASCRLLPVRTRQTAPPAFSGGQEGARGGWRRAGVQTQEDRGDVVSEKGLFLSGYLVAVSRSTLPPEYSEWLDALKSQIRQAQGRAALTANAEMIQLYWRIGREILAKQAAAGWGKRVIDRLAEEAIWQQRAAKLEPRRHRRGFSFRLFELSCWNLPRSPVIGGASNVVVDWR